MKSATVCPVVLLATCAVLALAGCDKREEPVKPVPPPKAAGYPLPDFTRDATVLSGLDFTRDDALINGRGIQGLLPDPGRAPGRHGGGHQEVLP